jgi:hypothetical protein
MTRIDTGTGAEAGADGGTDEGDAPGSLLQKTRAMLSEKKRSSYFKIYDATGLHPNWLSGVATGRIRDPSVNRIQALYEFLKGQALPLDETKKTENV